MKKTVLHKHLNYISETGVAYISSKQIYNQSVLAGLDSNSLSSMFLKQMVKQVNKRTEL